MADWCNDEQPEFKLNTGWVYDSGIAKCWPEFERTGGREELGDEFNC